MLIESEVIRLNHGGVTLTDLAGMSVWEVFDRIVAGRRLESEARSFALDAAAFAWADRQSRLDIVGRVERLARSEVRRKTAMEVLPAARRIERIGFMLGRLGDRWAAKNAAELRWLAGQGVTPEEAIRRHAEWHRREVESDPFLARVRAEREERRRRFAP